MTSPKRIKICLGETFFSNFSNRKTFPSIFSVKRTSIKRKPHKQPLARVPSVTPYTVFTV